MDFENKKIGIWGFGIVGKSALNFFSHKSVNISIMDRRSLSPEEQKTLERCNIPFFTQNQKTVEQFLREHDYILISPGIDIRSYNFCQNNKFISELDLFRQYFTKPIVAVTGTVGKTTVTHLLTKVLTHTGKKIACGGNIGTGLLDLISQQHNVDMAVIEVSSFQIERSHLFSPDFAIITNIYENHLDRHNNMEEYVTIKMSLINRQNSKQQALLTNSVAKMCNAYGILLPQHCTIIDDGNNFSNELFVRSAAKMLGSSVDSTYALYADANIQEHRCEFVATHNGISFYNDSKSTITESTLLATRKFNQPTLLLLGGINKTQIKQQDRERLIQQLPKNVIYIAAFGTEAELIKNVSTIIPCENFASLEPAFAACLKRANFDDIILLSPGGSSYDLYANYKERGAHFKHLIKAFNSNQN